MNRLLAKDAIVGGLYWRWDETPDETWTFIPCVFLGKERDDQSVLMFHFLTPAGPTNYQDIYEIQDNER